MCIRMCRMCTTSTGIVNWLINWGQIPFIQKLMEEAKASMLADEGALTKAQLNQLKKTVPKSKGGTVRSSLFGN